MDGAGVGWNIITFIGPLLLVIVIIYAMVRNRQKSSRRDIARTEEATRELYRSPDPAETARDDKVQR